LKSRKLVSRVLLLSLAVMLFAAPVLGQANSGKAVIYIGGSYNKALPDGAQNGFFGIDMFGGKMLTNNICLGASAGYNMVHFYKYSIAATPTQAAGNYTETLAVIPALIKVRYYHSLSRMMQINLQLGVGAYSTIAGLGGNRVGGVDKNMVRPGGSIGIGFDYWFLLTTGVSFEFEYHAFTTSDDYGTFDYWQFRVDYGIIKF